MWLYIIIMELGIRLLSKSNDEKKKNFLLIELNKYIVQKKNLKSPPKSTRGLSILHSSTLHKVIKISRDNSSDSQRQKVHQIPITRHHTHRSPVHKMNGYAIDESLLLQNVFKKIAETYPAFSSIKETTDLELHVSVLKQFWLDCCVCESYFFNQLMEGLCKRNWVNCDLFLKAFNEIQSRILFSEISSDRLKSGRSFNLRVQKNLCNW